MSSFLGKLSSLPLSLSLSLSIRSSNSSAKDATVREDWRKRSRPIPPGGTYPAKDHCSRCGLCDTYYIAHVKNACAFLGDGMSRIERLEPVVHGRGRKTDTLDETYLGVYEELLYARKLKPVEAPGTGVAAMDSYLALKKEVADISPELKGTSIYLVGLKSSLKANLGKMLADILRYYYFDSDFLVEEAVGGASAAKSYREMNEKDFCAYKTEVLKQLSSMGRLVVCAGNGAVQSSTNLALLRYGITLWIDVPLDIVARDAIEDKNQFPSFEISTSGSYTEVINQLDALYNKYKDGYATADAIISLKKVASRLGCDNFDDITAKDMTLEALREIQTLIRAKKMMEEAARPF